MSTVNDIKKSFENTKFDLVSKTDEDLGKQTKRNFRLGLAKLSNTFLTAVQEDKIKILDVKDLKDLASVMALLDQGTDELNNAPAMTSFATNFFNVQFGRDKSVGEPNPIDVTKTVASMSADEVAKMIANHTKDMDKENAKNED